MAKKKKENTREKKVTNQKNIEKKAYENQPEPQNNEISKLLKIVLIVTGIMIVFYGVTLLVTKKSDEVINEQKEKQTPEQAEIQYENIIIGSMLSHSGTYYVLIEEKDDIRISEYDSIITTIKSSEDAPKIYKANLTDSFNKTYLGKESNYYVQNMDDFKVIGTTLIKIKDGKIDTVKDTYDGIKNMLKELV